MALKSCFETDHYYGIAIKPFSFSFFVSRLSFVTNNLTDFTEGGSSGEGPPEEGPHFRIVRVQLGEESYLMP